MAKIKRPDIKFERLENTVKTAELCEKKFNEYKTWVDTLDEKKCKEEEKEIIKTIDEYEGTLKEKTYTLGKKVEFEGRIFTREKVFKYIQEIVNKREASYQETLGLYQMYMFWGSAKDTVTYPVLDSTLRTLESTPKFKGVTEWEKILVINEYFKENNEEMTMDYLQQIYYAHLHNALIDRMQLIAPKENHDIEAKEGPVMIDEAPVDAKKTK